MSLSTAKPTKCPVHPAKTDHPGNLPSLIGVVAVHFMGSFFGEQQIWVIAGHTGHFVGFVVLRLIYEIVI